MTTASRYRHFIFTMFETLKDEEIIRHLKRAELSDTLLGKAESNDATRLDAERIFAILVERHHASFTRLVTLRFGLDFSSADEITQDFWLECYTALPRYNPDRPFLSWATTILFRTAERFLHKRRKEIQISPQSDFFAQQISPHESLEENAINDAQIKEMLAALRHLPQDLALLIELRFFQNKKIEDICEQTGLARSTVFEKLNLAYKKLRAHIQ
ncbi:MAG TPA: sigma-70 family RNA polymerase sigma factor [Turneriella sp.]|nr:sigma-70 family RNA polymerase sigma factor [Turneriella sp.]